MRTQTKCTLTLSGLLIIEILPIPLTSLITFYAIRRRPKWVPGVVQRLYAEKEIESDIDPSQLDEYASKRSRRRCTISLCFMVLLDFLIPCTIFTGLFITRKRPAWFKKTVGSLYYEFLVENEMLDDFFGSDSSQFRGKGDLENQLSRLNKSNDEYALAMANKKK